MPDGREKRAHRLHYIFSPCIVLCWLFSFEQYITVDRMYLSIISESRLDVLSPYKYSYIYPSCVLNEWCGIQWPPNAIQCGWCATLLCYGHCDLWIHSFYVFVLLLPLRHFISQRYSFGKFSRFIRHHHRIVQCAMVSTYKVYVEVLGFCFILFRHWNGENKHIWQGRRCRTGRLSSAILGNIFIYLIFIKIKKEMPFKFLEQFSCNRYTLYPWMI